MLRLEAIPGGATAIGGGQASAGAAKGAGFALLTAAVLLAGAMHWQLDLLLGRLDEATVSQAAHAFEGAIAQQRKHVLALAAVLADDTRIRAPVMTPNIDEATMRDVLDDVKKSAGASLVAVLDVTGKVRAASGVQGLRDMDLGSSPVVKGALERPSTDVWTLPDRVMVVGVTAVRAAGQTAALLVLGTEVGESLLGAIKTSVGAEGAVLIRDRVAASSATDPGVLQAFHAANAVEDEAVQAAGEGQDYVVRVNRTSHGAASAKVVWLVAHHHQSGRTLALQIMNWVPVLLVSLTFWLVFVLARRRARA